MRHSHHLVASAWFPGLAALVLAAGCERSDHAGEAAVVRRLRVDTTAPAPGTVQLMRAQGESVFYGLLAKGTCSQCHDGQREPGDKARDLRHSAWLRQASFPSIIHYITHGWRDPREDTPGSSHPGSDSLSGEHIRAVAAYLEAVSRKEEGTSSP